MEIVHEIFDGKVRGIAATIINAALTKTLDLHYVFTEEFAALFMRPVFKPEMTNIQDWLASIPYFNSVNRYDWPTQFGTIDISDEECMDGATLAGIVVCNIYSDFCINADDLLYVRVSVPGSVEYMPTILLHTDWFLIGKGDFIFISPLGEEDLHLHIMSNMVVAANKNHEESVDPTPGTDIMRILEIDDEKSIESQTIHKGFVASLLNALFTDSAYAHFFNMNMFDEKEAWVLCGYRIKFVTMESLPYNLHIPALRINEEYLQSALVMMKYHLTLNDIDYDGTEIYSLRKMLEIELQQSRTLNQSRLWQMFEPEFQQMISAYHQRFIQYLREKIGDDQHISLTKPIGTSISIEQEPSARVKVLFVDANGYEDVERKEEEKARVLQYIAEHKYGNKELDASSENPLNKMAVAFVLRWKEKKLIPIFSPTALVRFLKEDCGLSCSVDDKTLSNLFGRMVKKNEKNDVYYDVCDYFN